MTLVKVYVTYKKSILDPQGEAIKKAVHSLGHTGIEDIRMGKYFELKVDDDVSDLDDEINIVCDKLLANPNMETYSYEILGDNI